MALSSSQVRRRKERRRAAMHVRLDEVVLALGHGDEAEDALLGRRRMISAALASDALAVLEEGGEELDPRRFVVGDVVRHAEVVDDLVPRRAFGREAARAAD